MEFFKPEQHRVKGLKLPKKPLLRKAFSKVLSIRRIKKAEPVIDPLPPEKVAAEIQHLYENGGLLFERSDYQVFVGAADQIPGIIRELGRLREITFRQVGEGTNQALDVDGYDNYYRHLFLWDKNAAAIVGAYRLGFGDEIISRFGLKGFYISSLFHLDPKIIPILSKTLELGRSFVAKAYQQKPLPLFLLWQGIIEILRQNRGFLYITGPVSISNDFSALSKELIIAFIRKNHFNHELAALVKPRHEFKVKTKPFDLDQVLENYSDDFHKLDKLIANIESGTMKVPVLLKQYIRQNAKIICFNVDPKFNNSLDGLMILNLKDLPEDTLRQLKDSEGMNSEDC